MQEYKSRFYEERMENEIKPWLLNDVQEGSLKCPDGMTIQYYTAVPENPSGYVCISHGFCEFFGKYHEMCHEMYEEGFGIFFVEHRGHGHSGREVEEPDVVHVDNFDRYVDDLKRFYDEVYHPASEDGKRFLFSHSMGGAIGALYLETYPDDFDRAVFNAPMFGFNTRGVPNPVVKMLIRKAELLKQEKQIAPHTSHFSGKPPLNHMGLYDEDRLNHEYDIRLNDALCTSNAPSAAWIKAAYEGTEKAKRNADKVKIPMLIIQCEHDEWVLNEDQDKFISRAESAEKYFFEGVPHEVFNCPEETRAAHLNLILSFFNGNTASD